MKDKAPIGWLAFWLGLRIVTAFVLFSSFVSFYVAIRSPHPDPHEVSLFAFWASVGIYLHPVSSGYAGRAEIHFRRYLFLQFAP